MPINIIAEMIQVLTNIMTIRMIVRSQRRGKHNHADRNGTHEHHDRMFDRSKYWDKCNRINRNQSVSTRTTTAWGVDCINTHNLRLSSITVDCTSADTIRLYVITRQRVGRTGTHTLRLPITMGCSNTDIVRLSVVTRQRAPRLDLTPLPARFTP